MAEHFDSKVCIQAHYSPQRLPQFQGNRLIEALPPSMDDEALYQALLYRPEFSPEQLEWPKHERLQMIGSLSNFMVPLMRHLELARALDTLIRNGYVGREPRTPKHTAMFQRIYEMQQAGQSFRQTAGSRTPQLSSSLIGISGMGKTTTVTRWLGHIPKVIYHPELYIYQIPYLHVEMPSDGSSIKGLARGILQQVDQLIPGANYYEEYALKGKVGADSLMRNVARVMHLHCVGLLIADEIQNLANSRKGAETVMTELVSACNELHVPILFIGTNKAAKILGKDFRQARRSSGQGIAHWDRFPEHVEPGEINEWKDFLEVLWTFQWTKKPVPLDPLIATTMYRCSQGVIDVAIKLFASAQARAIADGSEELCIELIEDVYERELKLLHPMLEALRKEDLEALANFDDIAPIGLEDILSGIERKLRSRSSALHKVKPGDQTFKPRVAASLAALGLPEDEALAAAERVEAGAASTLGEAAVQALNATTKVPRRVSRSKKSQAEVVQVDFSERPDDYRRAIQEARSNGVSTLDQMKLLGMVKPLDELLALG